MGFFNYLMKGIGFETSNEDKKPKKEKIKPTVKQEQPKGKFDDLYMASSFESSNQNTNTVSAFQYSSQENGASVSKNVIIYVPSSQNDIKNLIDFLRRKEPIIVNFSKLDDSLAPKMLSFVSGALYALKGSIHPIADDLFLLTPEGVSILVPRKTAPHEDDFK